MARVLLELYSSDSTENAISMLSRDYDRTVFFCSPDLIPNSRKQARMISLFHRQFGSEVSFRDISECTFEAVIESFVKETPEIPGNSYYFDLTGGSSLFIAAAGYFVSSSSRDDISMHLYDPRRGEIVFGKGTPAPEADRALLFSDAVMLNGGLQLSSEYGSELLGNRDFISDTMRLWNAVKMLPLEWNRFCSVPYLNPSLDSGEKIRRKTTKKNDETVCRKVLQSLEEAGIVESIVFGDGFCEYTLSEKIKNRELYEKSGTVLEILTALAAACTGLFYDISASTKLDYDGIILCEPDETRNEIDVTMMYGHLPVFISCKNTAVTKEYLYEIQTMAKHFGGKYAIPVIVSSVNSNLSIRNRAREMGIVLIYGISTISRNEFSTLLSRKFLKRFPRIHSRLDRLPQPAAVATLSS